MSKAQQAHQLARLDMAVELHDVVELRGAHLRLELGAQRPVTNEVKLQCKPVARSRATASITVTTL